MSVVSVTQSVQTSGEVDVAKLDGSGPYGRLSAHLEPLVTANWTSTLGGGAGGGDGGGDGGGRDGGGGGGGTGALAGGYGGGDDGDADGGGGDGEAEGGPQTWFSELVQIHCFKSGACTRV